MKPKNIRTQGVNKLQQKSVYYVDTDNTSD